MPIKLITIIVAMYKRKMVPNILRFANCCLLIATYKNGMKYVKFMTAYTMYAFCIPSTIETGISGLLHSLGIS
jgi:hypothetical protein